MKIVCPNCAAKYTIADDKARGKSVKIKCKKCGTSIVAGGDEGAAAANAWSVNIGEDDQRTLPIDQIAALARQGVVSEDTFVWREGMADWLPISAVPELRSALKPADEDMPTRMGEVPPEVLAMGRGDAPAPAARRVAPRGNDLFNPAPAPVDEDQVTRVATAAEHLRPQTAARVPQPRRSAPPPAAAPIANSEASGLIDIRTLQASLKGRESAAQDKKRSDDKLDDIMSLGVGSPLFAPAPAFAAIDLNAPSPPEPPPPAPVAVAAPVAATQLAPMPMAAEAPKKKTGMIVAALVGVVVLVGTAAGVGLMVGKKGDSGDGKVAAVTQPADKAPAGDKAPVADSPAPSAAAAPRPDDAKKDDPAPADTAASPDTPAAAASWDGTKGPLKKKKDPKDKDDDKTAKKDDPKKDDPKPPPPKEEKKDDPPPAAAGGSSDQPFDRGAASASLGSIAGSVGGCKKPDGPTGSGRAAVTFANSGSATSVSLEGAFGGTPVGTCITNMFKRARVPAFGGSSVTVKKSFNIN